VKPDQDYGVAFAVMCNEFSGDVTGDCAYDDGLWGTFEVKAGATAEFGNPEDGQTSDPPRKNAFLRHDFPPLKLIVLGD
jgi:hypothetical protein